MVAPHGRLQLTLTAAVEGDRITNYRLIADAVRLAGLELTVLDRQRG